MMGVLLIGESNSGKTHYGAQLLGRLQMRRGALRMIGAPSLGAYQAALQRLNNGLAAEHTAQAVYADSLWQVQDSMGRMADIHWPDYGGEQVKDILERRAISKAWCERTRNSHAWVLIVRPRQAEGRADIFSRPLADLRGRAEGNTGFELSSQARLVELLQIMLFARGTGLRGPLEQPRLCVLLSCWDELGIQDGAQPAEVLRDHLPLLSAFLNANWNELSIFGLSALERDLDPDTPDDDYVNRGPEAFGYVVKDDGTHDADLTLPLARLIACG